MEMRLKIVAILVFVILLATSCETFDPSSGDNGGAEATETGREEIYSVDSPPYVEPFVSSPSEANLWVFNHIKYRIHIDSVWRAPEETLRIGEGVCRDMALLEIKILKDSLNADATLVILDSRSGDSGHALVTYMGEYYDPTNGTTSASLSKYLGEFTENKRISYGQAVKEFNVKEEHPITARNNSETLICDANLRNGPGTNYSILMSITTGSNPEVLEEQNGWKKVRGSVEGVETVGWVYGEYLEPDGLQSDQYILTQDANLRFGPSRITKPLLVLAAGWTLTVEKSQDGWDKVTVIVKGVSYSGWIFSDYLSLKN